jgi:ubiquinone/menaquinone biosynthesis C-methylase UbiE
MTQTTEPRDSARPHSVCPWWIGVLMANPLRRLVEKPEAILGPLVRSGMIVLEPGPAMGFFTLPLARMVGETGRIICADLQPRMLESLGRRAERAGVRQRLELVTATPTDLGIGTWGGRVDLAVVIHMLHEVPDQAAFLAQVFAALRPGGRLFIREPKGHVSPEAFAVSLATAAAAGFEPDDSGVPSAGLCAIVRKPAGAPA